MADKTPESPKQEPAPAKPLVDLWVLRKVVADAPTLQEVLARPQVYDAWRKKALEALNG